MDRVIRTGRIPARHQRFKRNLYTFFFSCGIATTLLYSTITRSNGTIKVIIAIYLTTLILSSIYMVVSVIAVNCWHYSYRRVKRRLKANLLVIIAIACMVLTIGCPIQHRIDQKQKIYSNYSSSSFDDIGGTENENVHNYI